MRELRAVRPGLVAAALLVGVALPAPAIDAPSDGEALLNARRLSMPVVGVERSALVDTFQQGRPGHRHEAIDIAAPRGTRVVAVADGRVAKLFRSVPGGLTVYQFDEDGRLAYYYAHLDAYAETLREGLWLRRCDPIGTVGSTGNAREDAPHLHFAVFRLGSEKRWWQGEAVDPFPALTRADAGPPCA